MERPKILKIEWRHPRTGGTRILQMIKDLHTQLKKKNIDIILIEKNSKTSEILFNDLPMEFLLDEARVRENFCGSCSTPAERKRKSEAISVELIKKAALKAAGLL